VLSSMSPLMLLLLGAILGMFVIPKVRSKVGL
jgi:hypothetical protein